MSPSSSLPLSGVSSPVIILNSVVLPAPLAPITPTIPARGRSKDSDSISRRSPKPLDSVGRGQHLLAEARARRDVDLDLVELDVALFGDQLLVAGQARLGLRAFALGVGAHPFELGGDRALAALFRALFLGHARLLLLEPARVVALVGDALAAVELEDPAGDVVEEVAVVRDGDDRALVLGQVLLQPRDRLGVEVVGGLVQQQQVGRAQQQAAQRHAAALAAGERAHVRVGRRQAQRVHRVFELRVEVPRVGRFDLGLDPAELLGRLIGVVGGQLVEAVEQRLRLGDAVLDVALARPCSRPGAAPARASRRSHPGASAASPRYSWSIAGHDPQQRRLAGAVVAEHADLRARVERQRDVVEHRLVRRMELRQAVHREDVLGGHSHAG